MTAVAGVPLPDGMTTARLRTLLRLMASAVTSGDPRHAALLAGEDEGLAVELAAGLGSTAAVRAAVRGMDATGRWPAPDPWPPAHYPQLTPVVPPVGLSAAGVPSGARCLCGHPRDAHAAVSCRRPGCGCRVHRTRQPLEEIL